MKCMSTIEMHLQEPIFNYIKYGTKRFELRLLDEKRKNVKIGDEIVFINRNNDNDRIKTRVIGLLFYSNFSELVSDLDIRLMMDESMTKGELINELNKFYPAEEQKELGVVGIRFELES